MEENVALDSQKQKKFVRSIRGIKKLIQKSKENEEPKDDGNNETQEPGKPFSMRLKGDRVKKSKRKPKGLVYLGHIPHGFYEHQMTQYFKQFGVVTNARVIRSPRTGNSKGYAFVEFKDPSVAQIVAETMNNYLMGKRLIKAEYIPPEKQRRAFRKRWTALNNPTRERRLKFKRLHNRDRTDEEELKRARRMLLNFNKLKKKLSGMGINYDFFTPVDIPQELIDDMVKRETQENVESKKNKKEKNVQKTDKDKGKEKAVENKQVTVKKQDKVEILAPKKVLKKEKEPVVVNKKEQKQKKKDLKAAGGVKTLEEFIEVGGEGDDSDSSDGFDSDEYEKALEIEDEGDDLSSDESDESEGDEDDDDEEDDESDESEDEEPPKPVKAKAQPQKRPPQQNNRNTDQRFGGPSKKPKFEKQNKKPLKKQFKKK